MIDGLYRAVSEQILGHLRAIERALKRISLSTDLHLSETITSSKRLNNFFLTVTFGPLTTER